MKLEKKRIVHQAGGVVFRKVQRGEIMLVVFDFGAFLNGEAEIREDGGDFFGYLGDGMDFAALLRAEGKRYIDAFRLQASIDACFFKYCAAGLDGGFEGLLDLVDGGAEGFAFLGRQGAQRFELFGDETFFAQPGDASFLQRGEGGAIANSF